MNEIITIPVEHYQRLVLASQDLEDLQAVEAYFSKPCDGLASVYVKRMIDGESLLKLWRESRGHSQVQLAALSGVNRVQIGDIEDRGKVGSVETLKKLADVLNLRVDDLIK